MMNIRIGQTRVRDKHGCIGTVCYSGPVATSSSSSSSSKQYYGIRWDDTSRGKHNGSVLNKDTGEIVSYFDAGHPTGGSFVVAKKLDTGRPLTVEVIRERYRRMGDVDDTEEDRQVHTVQTASGGSKPIEFVGQDKILSQQQWEHLDHMSLRCMGISSVPSLTDESKEENHYWHELQHLTSVDVAGNLLSDWRDVFNLLDSFPLLARVSVANNRMVGTSLTPKVCDIKLYESLTYLNLRQCNLMSFETLLTVAKTCPNLTELCVAHSTFDDLLSMDDAHSNSPLLSLTNLDATACGLSTEHVRSLASWCPDVSVLSLNNNPLQAWPTAEEGGVSVFKHLEALHLEQTQITNWQDLQPLLLSSPGLRSLRLQHCPLTLSHPAHAVRASVLAAFASLQQFNASEIKDRADVERHYLILHLRQKQEAEETTLTVLQLPEVRYQELCSKYPEILARKGQGGDTSSGSMEDSALILANSVVTVHIVSFAPQSCTMAPLIRKLPRRLAVGRLKALCARHFGLDIDLQDLQYKNKSGGLPVAMDKDDYSLEECGVIDGAEIMMKEVDLKERERERERSQQEHLRRIEEQQAERKQFERHKEMMQGVKL